MDKTIQGLTNLSNLTDDDLLIAWDSTEADVKNRTKKISPDVVSKYVGVAGQNSAIITSNAKDVSITMAGKQANDGMILCLTFTQAITGQETDTMTLSFNGESPKVVKVAKNGVLENFTPFDVGGTYTFLQAYTNLLLQRDETDNCYLIVGNPQVYKTSDYTIYADGLKVYSVEQINRTLGNYPFIVRKSKYMNTGDTEEFTLSVNHAYLFIANGTFATATSGAWIIYNGGNAERTIQLDIATGISISVQGTKLTCTYSYPSSDNELMSLIQLY